jgi:hypothetical protein
LVNNAILGQFSLLEVYLHLPHDFCLTSSWLTTSLSLNLLSLETSAADHTSLVYGSTPGLGS